MYECIEVKQSRETDDVLEEEGPLDGEEDIDWDLEFQQTQYQRPHSSGSDRAVYSSDGVGSPMDMSSP